MTAGKPRSNTTKAVLATAGIALVFVFLSLGVWQIKRLVWKLDLIQRVEQRLSQPPAPLPDQVWQEGFDVAAHEYVPVQLQGRWLLERTVLTQATTELGAGYWVLTPLQLSNGHCVLVNRGFVPAPQREQWQQGGPTAPDAPTAVVVTGLLRLSEPGGGYLRRNEPLAQRWYSRDVLAIAQAQGLAKAAPFFIDAGMPSARPTLPESLAQGPWPREGLTVVRFSNSHLVYALTWFGLAGMVVAAGVLVWRYERRSRRGAPPDAA